MPETKSPVIEGLEKFESVFGGPACGQPQYRGLPALVSKDEERTVMSRWKFSDVERIKIAEGADMFLRIWTFGKPYPPTSISILGPVDGLSPSHYVSEFQLPLTQTEIDKLQADWNAKAEAQRSETNRMPALRLDVLKFAVDMSAAMDSKQVERETRKEPHYMSETYELKHAIDCMKDKIEQLESHVQRGNKDRAIKTAVHLANFCMIVAAKTSAGHQLPATPTTK